MEYSIDAMKPSDWEQVRNIYLEGIQSGIATFQTGAPEWEQWHNAHLTCCRIVARSVNNVLGWAALSPTSSRACYKGVVEVSIYIGNNYKGHGIGSALLTNLIRQSEENGLWTLYSAIIRENEGSIALHKKCGFREMGIREKVAKMGNGVWHDVVLMERRSKIAGID